MSFQQKTLILARQRVGELCAGFGGYISAFEAEVLFTGPSLYFHHKTLSIRRGLGCSVEACLESEGFFESLYATLTSWGLHRMGPGNTRLVDLPVMVRGFRRQAENLKILEHLALNTGIVVSRERLLGESLGYAFEGSERTIDTHVKNLRAKLGDPGWIETVRGFGYRFAGTRTAAGG